jgi:GMP synthase (glutamine-hydrolysing)
MKIHIIQHVPFEKPGLILDWIEERGHSYEMIKMYTHDRIPSSEGIYFLVVLGGPMSANDSDEWIIQERELIKKVVEQGKPMFGICLGAQQLAKAFGGEVVPAPKEIGWGEIQARISGEFLTVLHWHGEGFTLPENTELIYSSELWTNQGFRLNNSIGLQFHFETTTKTVAEIVEADSAFLKQSVFETSEDETIKKQIPPKNKEILFGLLDELYQSIEVNK